MALLGCSGCQHEKPMSGVQWSKVGLCLLSCSWCSRCIRAQIIKSYCSFLGISTFISLYFYILIFLNLKVGLCWLSCSCCSRCKRALLFAQLIHVNTKLFFFFSPKPLIVSNSWHVMVSTVMTTQGYNWASLAQGCCRVMSRPEQLESTQEHSDGKIKRRLLCGLGTRHKTYITYEKVHRKSIVNMNILKIKVVNIESDNH